MWVTEMQHERVIWSKSGVWYQTENKTSYLGHVARKEDVSAWCAQVGIEFQDFARAVVTALPKTSGTLPLFVIARQQREPSGVH